MGKYLQKNRFPPSEKSLPLNLSNRNVLFPLNSICKKIHYKKKAFIQLVKYNIISKEILSINWKEKLGQKNFILLRDYFTILLTLMSNKLYLVIISIFGKSKKNNFFFKSKKSILFFDVELSFLHSESVFLLSDSKYDSNAGINSFFWK